MYVSLEGLRATFKISKDQCTTQSCHLVFDLIRIKSKIKPTGVVFLSVSVFKTFLSSEDSIKSSWILNKSLVFHSSDFTELIKYEEFSGEGNGGFTWRQSFATKVGRKGPNRVSFKASFTVETSLPVVYIDK